MKRILSVAALLLVSYFGSSTVQAAPPHHGAGAGAGVAVGHKHVGAGVGVGVGHKHVGAGVGVGVGHNHGAVNLGIGFGIARGGINLTVGSVGFNQRYVMAGQAWVNAPYIWYQYVPDPFTGRVVPVQRIGYTRRLVVLYYDTWQGGYGYFDQFGNPVPYNNRLPW